MQCCCYYYQAISNLDMGDMAAFAVGLASMPFEFNSAWA